MANKELKKEIEKQKESYNKIMKGIEKLPNKKKGTIKTEGINQYTEPITEQTTASNTKQTLNKYMKLLNNKTENVENALKNKDEIKNRTSMRIFLFNNEEETAIINVIGILPEETGLIYEHFQGITIPSNEWESKAKSLEEKLKSISKTKVNVILEDKPQGYFQVRNIVGQTTFQ